MNKRQFISRNSIDPQGRDANVLNLNNEIQKLKEKEKSSEKKFADTLARVSKTYEEDRKKLFVALAILSILCISIFIAYMRQKQEKGQISDKLRASEYNLLLIEFEKKQLMIQLKNAQDKITFASGEKKDISLQLKTCQSTISKEKNQLIRCEDKGKYCRKEKSRISQELKKCQTQRQQQKILKSLTIQIESENRLSKQTYIQELMEENAELRLKARQLEFDNQKIEICQSEAKQSKDTLETFKKQSKQIIEKKDKQIYQQFTQINKLTMTHGLSIANFTAQIAITKSKLRDCEEKNSFLQQIQSIFDRGDASNRISQNKKQSNIFILSLATICFPLILSSYNKLIKFNQLKL